MKISMGMERQIRYNNCIIVMQGIPPEHNPNCVLNDIHEYLIILRP